MSNLLGGLRRSIPRSLALALVLVCSCLTWASPAPAAPDPAQLEADCRQAVSTARERLGLPDDETDDIGVGEPLSLYQAIDSRCGDTLFWFRTGAALGEGDAVDGTMAYALALTRLALMDKIEEEPCPGDACALFGSLQALYGPYFSRLLAERNDLYRAGIRQAIAFDLAHPSVLYPPDVHPEAYEQIRARLAAMLDWKPRD